MVRVNINGSFLEQKITGQQRYASEISKRLLSFPRDSNRSIEITLREELRSKSRLVAWLKVLTLHLFIPRDEWLLTLTSRGPLFRKRHAIVLHDLFVITNREWFSFKYWITHSLFLRIQLRRAKLVFCVSEPVATQLMAMKLTKARIFVAPNAPSEKFVKASLNIEEDRRFLRNNNLQEKKFLLSVGTQDPRKNTLTLINAYKLIPEEKRSLVPLVLVGRETDLFKSREFDLNGNIIFLKDLDDEKLAVLYRKCLAFIMPSHAEGFGLPIIEALSSGARVVANDIQVFKWVAGPAATYVNCDDGPIALRDFLLELILNPSQEYNSSFVSRFSWESSAQIILDAFLLDQDGES